MNRLVHTLAALGLTALAASPVSGQDPALAFKMRGGSVSGSVYQMTLGRQTVGFGFEGSFPLHRGMLTAELSYDYFNAYRKETTPLGGPVYFAGNHDTSNPTNISTQYQGHTLMLRPNESLQAEKNTPRGIGLRVGYRAPAAWANGWDWQAGVTLDRRTTYHEVHMSLVPGYIDAHGDFQTIPSLETYQDPYYYEGALAARPVTKFQPGAYTGLSREFFGFMRTEFNLRYATFNQVRFQAFTSTGKAASYSESAKGGLVLEVALSVKL